MDNSTILIVLLVALFLIIFVVLKLKAKVKTIVEDYEAKLEPTNANSYATSGGGKIERELYGDGNAELDLKFRATQIPNGSTVSLVINSQKIGDIQTYKGGGFFKIETITGATVPQVRVGDRVEVVFENEPILSGVFYKD